MNEIEAGLMTKLSADTALVAELGGTAIYNRHAPQGTAMPFVIFNHAGGGHENINPSNLQNHVYMVKAVAAGAKQAGTIDALVIACLHNSVLTVTGFTNIWLAREEEVQLTETSREGAFIYHTGGYYRIRLDA